MAGQGDILAAVRARISAALPGAVDRSDLPEGAALARAPAYALRLERVSAERLSMGSPGFEVTDRLTLALWVVAGASVPPHQLELRAAAAAETAAAAVLAEPADLAGLVWDVRPESSDVSFEAGEVRAARAVMTFAVVHHTQA